MMALPCTVLFSVSVLRSVLASLTFRLGIEEPFQWTTEYLTGLLNLWFIDTVPVVLQSRSNSIYSVGLILSKSAMRWCRLLIIALRFVGSLSASEDTDTPKAELPLAVFLTPAT